ncbi:MAG: GatB/YqeY domain-containing protein [Nitrospiria bacterium]
MGIRTQLGDDLKAAMRSRSMDRVSVIRLLLSVIKNKEIEKGKGTALTENEVLSVIVTAVKQRRESIEQYAQAGRSELAEKESQELEVLLSYLPKPLSEDELRARVNEAITEAGISEMKQMGIVMKTLVPALRGRAEGTAIRKMLQSCLQGKG